MRNEQEMMALILDFANTDNNIRGAYMNGSRTNPTIKKDDFQDYDGSLPVMTFNPILTITHGSIISEKSPFYRKQTEQRRCCIRLTPGSTRISF